MNASAFGQLGYQRFREQKCANYWVSGLGDFSYHDTAGGIDGYEYRGGGYAVGADTRICPNNYLAGIAFGQCFGNNRSRTWPAKIDQRTYMSMIYGAWFKEWNKKDAFNLQGSVVWGLTNNKLTTSYLGEAHSTGSWDNNAVFFTLKGSWDHALNNNWTRTLFLGVEFTNARQAEFVETGDLARHLGKGTLYNLSVPMGVAFTKLASYQNGKKWINTFSMSYVPDVYRKNPEADARRLSNDFTWTARGVRPDRDSGRLEYTTRLIMDQTWSFFASYSLEGRKNALYQNANLGLSATF